ncbi:hypothetical protein Godav_029123 [Gossypium davidsonii]|uniref:Uncharacterized protein n=2 Tax=Gossypium TaxID=3633 RepID=A0A7J8TDS1_GOSDV|nr:hypothetical protein [Gossypium davidsonii]MBA0654442.1 hypothetical protein [Gossypium klotzschianum]
MGFFFPLDADSGSSKLVMKRVFNESFIERRKHQIQGQPALLVHSCNGLVLFESCTDSHEFYIRNPVTGELITMKKWYGRYKFCGFFYHSSAQEVSYIASSKLPMPNKRRRLCVHGTNKMNSKDEAVRDGRWANMLVFVATNGSSMGF